MQNQVHTSHANTKQAVAQLLAFAQVRPKHSTKATLNANSLCVA